MIGDLALAESTVEDVRPVHVWTDDAQNTEGDWGALGALVGAPMGALVGVCLALA